MAILDTYNYPYGVDHKTSPSGGDNDSESLERKYRRVRPGGNVTVLGLAKMRASVQRAESRQSKIEGYYD